MMYNLNIMCTDNQHSRHYADQSKQCYAAIRWCDSTPQALPACLLQEPNNSAAYPKRYAAEIPVGREARRGRIRS